MKRSNGKILGHCLAYGSHKMTERSESVAEFYEKGKTHLLTAPQVAYSNFQAHEARSINAPRSWSTRTVIRSLGGWQVAR